MPTTGVGWEPLGYPAAWSPARATPESYAAAVPISPTAPAAAPLLTAVPTGTLVVIGGAEEKLGRQPVLRRFAELAGGEDARIVVCATASALGDEITSLYDTVFRRLRVAEVVSVRPETREDADDPAAVAAVDSATAVFMTGGNQLKLSSIVTGTAFGDAIVQAYRRGAVVGGTSAGASAVSEHMVAFGTSGATPKNRISQLAKGLGLLPGVIVDQHFDQRNRYGRLLSLVAQNPSLLGMGVDEDTAAVISGGRLLEVLGRGSVFVFDGRSALTNASVATRTSPLLVSGAVVHALPVGARFDLVDVRLVDFAGRHEAELQAQGNADVPDPAGVPVARRVDAEGANDSVVQRNARRRERRRTGEDDDG
jgi:cyanophycinase